MDVNVSSQLNLTWKEIYTFNIKNYFARYFDFFGKGVGSIIKRNQREENYL